MTNEAKVRDLLGPRSQYIPEELVQEYLYSYGSVQKAAAALVEDFDSCYQLEDPC
jgi:hypothetical protein